MHSILVSKYMDHNPHAIVNTSNVRQTVQFLLKEKLSGVPVVDENRRLVGFVSEKDCITEVLNDAFYCDETPSVTTVMSKEVETATPETSIVEIAERMAKSHPHHYPVVKGDKLVGIISRNDILQAILENNDDCYL